MSPLSAVSSSALRRADTVRDSHRTLIVRKLKGLEAFFDVAIVHAHMGALGWSFYPPIRGEDGEYLKTTGEVGEDDGLKEVTRDPLYDSKFVRELYFKASRASCRLYSDAREAHQ